MGNLLRAITNLALYRDNNLAKITIISKEGQPRINKEGDPLDAFVKDAFCNTFLLKDPIKKSSEYHKVFSHLGSQNNPPDIMLRGGDAIEVKKVEGTKGISIALNSSYPKAKLCTSNLMITEECRKCEEWNEKDIIYCVGNVDKKKAKILFFVYGDCYAANAETYENVRKSMIEGIKKLDLKLSETKELARLNKVDPLEITNLRVRGMWEIKTPLLLFSDIVKPDQSRNFSVFALMKKEKYDLFSLQDKQKLTKLQGVNVETAKIRNPNKPQEMMNAILISFSC